MTLDHTYLSYPHFREKRQQQPQQERKAQHQQVQQPQQERQPQQQPQQVQQVPMFYQAHTPVLPMQAGMQGQVFVDPNDPNTLHYEGFDPGARFSKLAPPRVPPPPPGVMPNPAQLALMQGYNVVVTQRKSNVISGGSSGGVDTSCTLQ
nr:DAZ-associated protein 2-like [Rhipicephalus microplus]